MEPNNSSWKLVRLNFGRTPVHFGEQGIGLEVTSERIRSDTLFSAIVSSYARIYGKDAVEGLLESFKDLATPPPFRLSSTFIFKRVPGAKKDGWDIVYYVPKLLKRPHHYPAGDTDLPFAKTFKALHYLPLDVWQRWYQGEGFTESDRYQLIAKTQKNSSGYLGQALDQAGTFDYSNMFTKQQLPKVAIDRTTHASNFYHTGFVHYAWTSQPPSGITPNTDAIDDNEIIEGVISTTGLYFLIQFPQANTALETKLRGVLEFLGEEGIGGERSSGAGRFYPHWNPLPSEWAKAVGFNVSHHQHCLLSLFGEKDLSETWITDGDRYALQERGGWIVSPFSGRQQRRKSLQMFTEGSVFSTSPNGQLIDVTPYDRQGNPKFTKHPVYRSGLAVSLPIRP